MLIRFLKDHTTQEAKPRSFKKGDEVDLRRQYLDDENFVALHGDDAERRAALHAQASAGHFISRGLAEAVTDENRDAGEPAPKKSRKAEATKGEPADAYEDMKVEDLHAEVAARGIEGRSELTNKAALVKALRKHDRDNAK